MQETWNALVHDLNNTLELLQPLGQHEQKDLWDTHREICRRIVVESGLNWECGPAILDRFETARRLAVRGERGWPKQQLGIRSVMIPHCYTSGGMSVAGLFRSSRRMALRQVPTDAYADSRRETIRRRLTRGTFGFDGGTIEFETILHRPVPETAIIKGCAWVGERHPIRGWEWSITITAELPPVLLNKKAKSVAVDIGWRAFADAIRVAVALDDHGMVQEFRLPLDAARVHERRHNIPSGWRDLGVLDRQISMLFEHTMAELMSLPCPEAVRSVLLLQETRQSTFVRLLHQLRENADWPEAVDLLKKWQARNDRLRSIRASLSARLIGRRRWLYRNFAAQLCRNYSRIVLKRLPIKLIQKSPDSIGAAAQYRQWASPAELGLYLRQAAISYGAVIIEADEGLPTTTCAICGAQAVQTGNLILTCANGHSWDQDENAARNLLSRLDSVDHSPCSLGVRSETV